MINERQLRAFMATMWAGTMTGAAAEMNVSQPSVSRFIRELEYRVGFQLFVRTRRGLSPTPEGQAFYWEVERYFMGEEALLQKAGEIRRFGQGELNIASIPSVAFGAVAQSLFALRDEVGRIKANHDVRTSRYVKELTATSRIEVGICNPPYTHEGIEIVEEYVTECVLAMPQGHVLAERDIVTVEDLEDVSIVSIDPEPVLGSSEEHKTLALMKRNSCVRAPVGYVACMHVHAGLGVALIDPFTSAVAADLGLAIRRFEPAIPYQLAIIKPAVRASSRLAGKFIDHLAGVLAHHHARIPGTPALHA